MKKTKKRVRNSQKSRETLLRVALTEFSLHGFLGARVDRIANDSQINKAMLYYYFKNKRNLYRSVLKKIFENYLDHLKRQLQGAPDQEADIDVVSLFQEFLKNFYHKKEELKMISLELSHGGEDLIPILKEEVKKQPLKSIAMMTNGKKRKVPLSRLVSSSLQLVMASHLTHPISQLLEELPLIHNQSLLTNMSELIFA